ncbi:hypothetical protein BC829DRAFT_486560 [Chytridium lagenaria]|nr:hypothetical protein BC829DRAFT_486560 [Chytridium lagenaria]
MDIDEDMLEDTAQDIAEDEEIDEDDVADDAAEDDDDDDVVSTPKRSSRRSTGTRKRKSAGRRSARPTRKAASSPKKQSAEDEDEEDVDPVDESGEDGEEAIAGRRAKRGATEGSNESEVEDTPKKKKGRPPKGTPKKKGSPDKNNDSGAEEEVTTDSDEGLPVDPKGDEKVSKDGYLFGGENEEPFAKLYMMTMEVSKSLSFRDSYLFYLKNPNLRRINATEEDKIYLSELNILPTPSVTVLLRGRPGRDDYVTLEGNSNGTDEDGEDWEGWMSPLMTKTMIEELMGNLDSCGVSSGFNSKLRAQRREQFHDVHTNIDQVPVLTQAIIPKLEGALVPKNGDEVLEWKEITTDPETSLYPVSVISGQFQGTYSIHRTRFNDPDQPPFEAYGDDSYAASPYVAASIAATPGMPPSIMANSGSTPMMPQASMMLGTPIGMQAINMSNIPRTTMPTNPVAKKYRDEAPIIHMGPSGKYTVRFTCDEVTKTGKLCQRPVGEAGVKCLYHQKLKAKAMAAQHGGIMHMGGMSIPVTPNINYPTNAMAGMNPYMMNSLPPGMMPSGPNPAFPMEAAAVPETVDVAPRGNCCLCHKSSPPNILPDGKQGHPPTDPKMLLRCANCSLGHHLRCADLTTPAMVAKVQSYPWNCGNCKLCSLCKEAGDEEKLLLCDTCDRGYHTYCLKPEMDGLPKGNWLCPECAVCISCGRQPEPGKPTSDAEWRHVSTPPGPDEFRLTGSMEIYLCTYCLTCHEMFQDNRFCPICFHVYEEDSEDLAMACCDILIDGFMLVVTRN